MVSIDTLTEEFRRGAKGEQPRKIRRRFDLLVGCCCTTELQHLNNIDPNLAFVKVEYLATPSTEFKEAITLPAREIFTDDNLTTRKRRRTWLGEKGWQLPEEVFKQGGALVVRVSSKAIGLYARTKDRWWPWWTQTPDLSVYVDNEQIFDDPRWGIGPKSGEWSSEVSWREEFLLSPD